VLALVFVAINVPVLRTLVYGQINLHVANLILLALLAYPRLPVWSALALALAVHLKTSPIVLALPFVTERSWRWTAAFAAWLAAIAGAIYAAHGGEPFLEFLRNARGVYTWTDLSFRENSIDSFLRSTAALLGGPFSFVEQPPVRLVVKASVLALALAAMGIAIRRGAFVSGHVASSHVLNGWPALSVLMVLASPLVWEHHPVFTALPFLVITRKLRTPGEWAAWSLAYCVVYWLPTFDFYPWSFGRLAGLLILLALLYRVSGRSEDGQVCRMLHERLREPRVA
jgi:alpha-1,2-mannosyltransferase